MKEPWGFITIFTLMMLTIAYLSGCTQFDTHEGDTRYSKVHMVSNDGECEVMVLITKEISATDNSLEIDQRQ